jgi:hypothetical protein
VIALMIDGSGQRELKRVQLPRRSISRPLACKVARNSGSSPDIRLLLRHCQQVPIRSPTHGDRRDAWTVPATRSLLPVRFGKAASLACPFDTDRSLDLAFRAESQILDPRITARLCGPAPFWGAHDGLGRGR